jgi:hypothetical protein
MPIFMMATGTNESYDHRNNKCMHSPHTRGSTGNFILKRRNKIGYLNEDKQGSKYICANHLSGFHFFIIPLT